MQRSPIELTLLVLVMDQFVSGQLPQDLVAVTMREAGHSRHELRRHHLVVSHPCLNLYNHRRKRFRTNTNQTSQLTRTLLGKNVLR